MVQVNSDPKYDTDAVNLRYLNKVLESTEKENDDKIKQIPKNYGIQPLPPYFIGDSYTVGKKIYKCIKSRDIGSFTVSDWQLIVDGEELKKFVDGIYTLDKINIEKQLDNKIETYIQDEDPSLEWTTNIEREKHKGDYWRKNSLNGQREYCYTKMSTNPVSYSWIETDAPVPIYDLIDGKKTIYTSKPNSYNKDDMWIIENTLSDDDLPTNVKKGDWVFATENSDNYNKSHWVKRDEKVDIEYIEKNYYQITEIDNKFTEISRDTDSKITKAKDDISLSVSESYTTKEETISVVNRVSNVEENVGTITETTTTQGELLSQLNVSTGEIKQTLSETVQKQTNIETNLEDIDIDVANIKKQIENESVETIKKLTQITLDIDSISETVSNFSSQSETISKIELDVETIKQSIGSITDTTMTISGIGTLHLKNVLNSDLLYVQIYPTKSDLSYLYPSDDLYPSNDLFLLSRDLIFTNEENAYRFTLPCDLLYLSDTIKDEFILNYDTQEMYTIHRVGLDADGNKYALSQAQTQYFVYQPFVIEKDGDYTVKMQSFDDAYIYIRALAQNIYTSQYATKVELNNAITTTTQSINQSVNAKITQIDNNIVNLNASLELKLNTKDLLSEIALKSNLLTIDADNFKLSKNGHLTCNDATLNGIFEQHSSNGRLAIQIKNDDIAFYDTTSSTNGKTGGIMRDTVFNSGISLFAENGYSISFFVKDSMFIDNESVEILDPILLAQKDQITCYKNLRVLKAGNGAEVYDGTVTIGDKTITIVNGLITNIY